MPISEATYRMVALEDPEGKWELYCGRLQSKPAMTYAHNKVSWVLGHWLQLQLSLDDYEIRVDAGRTERASESFFVPDVMVIPKALTRPLRGLRDVLEAYAEPLPLVVEVWSPSTGGYDARTKLPEYQRRGDTEIWYIHPYDHTLTAWQRQPDGSYREAQHAGGIVQPVAMPGVSIDLDALFAI